MLIIQSTLSWLEHNGLWHFVVGWIVGGVLGWLAARKGLVRHVRILERIEDLLRTDTPGGLADVVKEERKRETVHR